MTIPSGAAPRGPRLLTNRSTHDLIIRLLDRDYPPPRSSLKLLDVPCGAGALSVRLREMGFEVSCCDIDPGHMEATGFRFTQADLNSKPLPLESNAYDVVVSVAGLQRVIFPDVAIGECGRILRPGGRLYLSVPNFGSMRLRFRYLLYGSLGFRFDNPHFEQTVGLPAAHFRFPLGYPRVESLVRAGGLRLLRVEAYAEDRVRWLLLPLALGSLVAARFKAALNPQKYGSYRTASRFDMLGSRAYVVVAEKPLT